MNTKLTKMYYLVFDTKDTESFNLLNSEEWDFLNQGTLSKDIEKLLKKKKIIIIPNHFNDKKYRSYYLSLICPSFKTHALLDTYCLENNIDANDGYYGYIKNID